MFERCCAGRYANNQHDTSGDVTADPEKSSFVRAIALAEGRVLTVLDEKGITYTRVWCCLEIYIGLGQTCRWPRIIDLRAYPY